MKHIRNLSIFITLLFGSLFVLSAQAYPLEETSLISLSRRDYKVGYQRNLNALTIDVDLTSYSKVKSQELLCIYPIYRSSDGKKECKLAPIYVVGDRRHKQIQRNKLLRNAQGVVYEIVNRPVESIYARKGDIIAPHYEIDFEPWMRNGELRLYMQRYGCASCPSALVSYQSEPIHLDAYNFGRYEYTFIRPADEQTKEYKKSFDSYVRFPYDSSELLFTSENSAELERLNRFIVASQQEEGVRLSSLAIVGYASPEGTANYNQRLSEYRAQSLYDYVQGRFPNLVATVKVSGEGEDWSGLRQLVSESTLDNKSQVLRIIDDVPTDAKRDKSMRQLGNYNHLLADYYPQLRRTTFTMSYEVGAFRTDELASVYAKNPLLLKQNELFFLAEQAMERGVSPVPYLRSAYEQYPKDPVAILNYANALLKYDHNAELAYQLLTPIRTDARAKLPLSVATEMMSSMNL